MYEYPLPFGGWLLLLKANCFLSGQSKSGKEANMWMLKGFADTVCPGM